MPTTTLADLFLNPGFISVFLAILVTIANVMIGVSMLPEDNRRKRYLLHRNVFFGVLVCFLFFLGWNHIKEENSSFNYFVLIYFLIIIPLSKRANVTAHAIIASVGLVLLTLAAVLDMG